MSYLQWNNAIGAHFFNDENAGQEIILYLNRKLIDKCGERFQLGGWKEFLAAMKQGPKLKPALADENLRKEMIWPLHYGQLLREYGEKSTFLVDGVSLDKIDYPTYLAVLALLVLAWTERPDQNEWGYYNALDAFLETEMGLQGGEKHRQVRNIQVRSMLVEFQTLAEWSRDDMNGQWGILLDEQIMDYAYVGRVKFHALISKQEMDMLPWFWAQLNFEPGNVPLEAVLENRLLGHAETPRLLPGIRGLLIRSGKKIRDLALQIMLRRFSNWDGIYVDPARPKIKRMIASNTLKLCITDDEKIGLRIWAPGGRGNIEFDFHGVVLRGHIDASGWSTVLRPVGKTTKWGVPAEFLSKNWKGTTQAQREVTYVARNLVQLMPLAFQGLVGQGFLEVDDLRGGSAFRILARGSHAAEVEKWGEKRENCGSLKPRKLSAGFEACGWRLYKGHGVQTSLSGKEMMAQVEREFSARWIGGMRNNAKAWYCCALPTLRVCAKHGIPEAWIGNEKLLIKEQVADWYMFGFPDGFCDDALGKDWEVSVKVARKVAWETKTRFTEQLPLPQLADGAAVKVGQRSESMEEGGPAVSHHQLLGESKSWAPYPGQYLAVEGDNMRFAPELAGNLANRVLAVANKKGVARRTALMEALRDHAMEQGADNPSDGHLGDAILSLEALGWFHLFQGRAQLAAPALVWLPYNRYRNRAVLSGVVTAPFFEALAQVLADSRLPVKAEWLPQPDPLLPPTLCLSSPFREAISKIASAMQARFPGYLYHDARHEYALSLLQFSAGLAKPEADQDTVRQVKTQVGGDFFCIKEGRFRQGPFPLTKYALERRRVEPQGYMVYTWWEDVIGIDCEPSAIWPLMRSFGIPLLMQSAERSDEIYLPSWLRLPGLVERALVMASGQCPEKVSPDDVAGLPERFPKGFHLRRFSGIRYPHRQQMVRLLYGEAALLTFKSSIVTLHSDS